MSLTILVWGSAALALISLVLGSLWIRNAATFIYWLKALSGILGLSLALALAAVAWELQRHDSVHGLKPVASLFISHLDGDRWRLTLFGPSSQELTREVRGELWQLQGQALTVQPWVQSLGLTPALRVHALDGRMRQLEDSLRTAGRIQHSGATPSWHAPVTDRLHYLLFPVYQAQTVKPAFAPLRDGAVYELWLSGQQLVASPANSEAENAWQRW